MKEYENFLEFGSAVPVSTDVLDSIEETLKKSFPMCTIRLFDNYISADTYAWTIGINDGYECQLSEIADKFANIPFVSKALSNTNLTINYYNYNKKPCISIPINIQI